MFTIFDQSKFLAARYNGENKSICLWLSGKSDPIYIYEDDELYQHNLESLEKIKDDIIKSKEVRNGSK